MDFFHLHMEIKKTHTSVNKKKCLLEFEEVVDSDGFKKNFKAEGN